MLLRLEYYAIFHAEIYCSMVVILFHGDLSKAALHGGGRGKVRRGDWEMERQGDGDH